MPDHLVQVIRAPARELSTPGQLVIDGEEVCFTLEDPPNEPKIPGQTRIPSGRFATRLHPKSRFQAKYRATFGPSHAGMILLLGVPNFEGVLIHCGNSPLDTSGCILVGLTQDVAGDGIGRSRDAYRRYILPLIEKMAQGASVEVWVR